jgi:hypothetical protein
MCTTNLKSKGVLYIGSGNSVLDIKGKDLSDYTVICANNAWKLFEDSKFDIWIRPDDFPKENYPTKGTKFRKKIGHSEYSTAIKKAAKMFNWDTPSPEHMVGYTTFFNGLYWIMMTLRPHTIGVLGFNHNYNPQKVQKWEKHEKPAIHNGFNGSKEKNINKWADKFFDGMGKDSFYGQGTPDPLRLGKGHLIEKFELAKVVAKNLDVKLVNYSTIESKINTLPHKKVKWRKI